MLRHPVLNLNQYDNVIMILKSTLQKILVEWELESLGRYMINFGEFRLKVNFNFYDFAL